MERDTRNGMGTIQTKQITNMKRPNPGNVLGIIIIIIIIVLSVLLNSCTHYAAPQQEIIEADEDFLYEMQHQRRPF